MDTPEIARSLSQRITRRTVVKTGTRLAYAAPLVALSFKLSGRGALAACPAPTVLVTAGFPPGSPQCCVCDCTIANVTLNADTGKCFDPLEPDKIEEATELCLTCIPEQREVSPPA
jgi:hypothetical protein